MLCINYITRFRKSIMSLFILYPYIFLCLMLDTVYNEIGLKINIIHEQNCIYNLTFNFIP